MEESRQAFALFDRDNDGRIQAGELGTLMRALGHKITESEVLEYVKEIDPKGTGIILFSDFATLMERLPPTDPAVAERELTEAFRVFDRDGKGTIPTAELRHIVTSLGEKLSDDEADQMMREADPLKTGLVDYASFIKKMLSV